MLGLPDLVCGLALEGGWSGEGGIGLEGGELGAKDRVLLFKISLQSVDVCEVVGQGL